MKFRNSGFTIIELSVTIVITGLVTLAITSLFISIEKSQRSSMMLESATRAGEQEVEALRNNNYTLLEPGSTIDFTNDLPDTLHSPRSGTVAISQPVDGLRRVDVTISYTDGNRSRQIILSSLIGQIGIGQ